MEPIPTGRSDGTSLQTLRHVSADSRYRRISSVFEFQCWQCSNSHEPLRSTRGQANTSQGTHKSVRPSRHSPQNHARVRPVLERRDGISRGGPISSGPVATCGDVESRRLFPPGNALHGTGQRTEETGRKLGTSTVRSASMRPQSLQPTAYSLQPTAHSPQPMSLLRAEFAQQVRGRRALYDPLGAATRPRHCQRRLP